MLKPGQIVKKFISKKGNEVILRAPKIGDAKDITEMINSIIVEDDFILFNEKQKFEDELKWLKGKIKSNKSGNLIYLVAEVNGKVVGGADIGCGIGRKSHVGGLGIAIMNGYREEGIGTQLMQAVLDYAKKTMKLKIVELEVYSTNERAQKLYQKIGFKKFGTLPKAIFAKKRYVDGIYMHKEL